MIYHETEHGILYNGESLEVLRTLPDNSVNCCITSPPYWGLRDYGTATWIGGDAECDHVETLNKHAGQRADRNQEGYKKQYKNTCAKCGAIRQDQQLGLERTPEEYVTRMVEIFREVRRVLKADGVLWLNLGDSYNGSGGAGGDYNAGGIKEGQPKYNGRNIGSLKPKDLVGIPWRVAFALQADGCTDYKAVQIIEHVRQEIYDNYRGEIMPDKVISVLEKLDKEYREAKGDSWYLRQDIIWHKPNPMPESVTDRCTKSHEYIFMLTKSGRYYFDSEAIKEPANYDGRKDTVMKGSAKYQNGYFPSETNTQSIALRGHERWKENADGVKVRNKRSVWTVTTKPYKEAHFATYPPDLILPCVKASPEYLCSECGTPYKRVITVIGKREGEVYVGQATKDYSSGKAQNPSDTKRRVLESMSRITKSSWQQGCSCCNAETKPAVILDPFFGSGTTGLVAVQNGRRYIGIDLNPKYCEIAVRRIESYLDQTTIDL